VSLFSQKWQISWTERRCDTDNAAKISDVTLGWINGATTRRKRTSPLNIASTGAIPEYHRAFWHSPFARIKESWRT